MTADFYDQLAPFYHLLYPDWERAVEIQGRALGALLRELGVAPGAHVHDAAAGIGTQTLVLLLQGHALSASDISPGAIQRLRHELTRGRLAAHTTVDDVRQLGSVETGSKDAVIACDNRIPHLFGDADILQAFGQCRRSLRPGGVVVFSVRDYATVERKSPDVSPYGLRSDGDQRALAVQVWEWQGDQYDLRIYLTTDDGSACRTEVLHSRYYAVPMARLLELLSQAGFVEVTRRDDVFFQPVIHGRKPRCRLNDE